MISATRALCCLAAASAWTRSASPSHRAAPRAVTEGHDAESDAVGPGIYGGRVEVDARGDVVIGQQFEEHNPIPGPVYAGGGYTDFSDAVRSGDEARVRALLSATPSLVGEVTTGAASPLHLTGMLRRAHPAAAVLVSAGAAVDARDAWGYTPLQRAATNDCVDAAKALLAAGASLEISSGLDGDGDNAYELAKRLRSYDCIFAFDDHIAAVNT